MEVLATQLDKNSDNKIPAEFCSLKICDSLPPIQTQKKKPRRVQSDLFTILLLIYHMVQWMKVKGTIGQSAESDDFDLE